jgi:membrane-bound lytic murein transglycosylase B
LAWEGRRAQFFREELFNALTIIDKGDVPASKMVGSWAGAMGQCQFMPSTYLKFAQDWEGDGKRDIWSDRGDVWASTANYLSSLGWKDDIGWGRPVRLPKGFDKKLISLDIKKSMKDWSKLGVTDDKGKKLPARSVEMSLVLADPENGPAFLITDNYRAVRTWNRSTLFALSVGHLADALGHR